MNGKELPRISCPMMKQPDGSWLTHIVKDGVVIDAVPTPKSQIRAPRQPLLWTTELKGFTSFIQQTKAHIEELERV